MSILAIFLIAGSVKITEILVNGGICGNDPNEKLQEYRAKLPRRAWDAKREGIDRGKDRFWYLKQ